MIHTSYSGSTYNTQENISDASVLLNKFNTGNGQGKVWDGYCLAHLFTYWVLSNGLLGLSNIASPSATTTGGICSTSFFTSSSGTRIIYNTALSSYTSSSNPLVFLEEVLVTGHEIGHSWGSYHDPATTPSCSNVFIMNHRTSIGAVLSAKAQNCFTVRGTGVCGDYVVTSGEQCDAGLLGDTCCTDACQLRSTAMCRVNPDQEGTGRDMKSGDRCMVEWTDKKMYAAQIDAVGSQKAMYDLLHVMEGSEEEEEPELEASDMGCEGFEDAEILENCYKNYQYGKGVCKDELTANRELHRGSSAIANPLTTMADEHYVKKIDAKLDQLICNQNQGLARQAHPQYRQAEVTAAMQTTQTVTVVCDKDTDVHLRYMYPYEPSEEPKRWKQILQTNMNAKCRHHRANKKSANNKDAAATEDDGGAVPG
eukprot:Em0020g290a